MVSGDDPGRLISCWRGGEEHVPEGGTSRTIFLFFRDTTNLVKTADSSMEKSRACGPPYPSKYLTFTKRAGAYLSIPDYPAQPSFKFSREREREVSLSSFSPFFFALFGHRFSIGSSLVPAFLVQTRDSISLFLSFSLIIEK